MPAHPFRLRHSDALLKQIHAVRDQFAAAGRADLFDDLLLHLLAGIRQDPLAFGEPTFNYRHLALTNCFAIAAPLAIEYAVDELRRIVYLRRVKAV